MAAVFAESIEALRSDDPRALDDGELRERLLACGRLRSQLDVAEAALIAEFDARGGFLLDGAVNTPSWLAHHTGVGRSSTGARVRLAKQLRRMPLVADALAAGLVTESHAQVLRRGLNPRTEAAFVRDEATLVAAAIGVEADELAHAVSDWLLVNDPDGPDPGSEKASELHVSALLDGRTRIDGELDLEDSVEFLAELEAVYDELWHQDQAARLTDPDKFRTVAQRKAAALTEMARRSSAAGDRDNDSDEDQPSHASTRRPRIPQFIVIVDVPALNGDPTGTAALDDGTPISQTLLSEWLCDCTVARVVLAGRSLTLDSGSLVYTPSPAQRRALIARDQRCIVPGCRRKARWCQAHHVISWPAGPTNLNNLAFVVQTPSQTGPQTDHQRRPRPHRRVRRHPPRRHPPLRTTTTNTRRMKRWAAAARRPASPRPIRGIGITFRARRCAALKPLRGARMAVRPCLTSSELACEGDASRSDAPLVDHRHDADKHERGQQQLDR